MLEDPFEEAAHPHRPVAAAVDPMLASVYEPSKVLPSAASPRPPPQRPPPDEVLEGAREKFDKFWAGGKKDPQ